MTGILVTKFKMGLIDVEDLEEMVADETTVEQCSAARKVLEAVRDSLEVQLQEGASGRRFLCCRDADSQD